MTAPIMLLFLADLSIAQHSDPTPYKFTLRDIKEPGKLANESAILSDIDDRDTFCKTNVNAIFPDPYSYNIYYRCRRNRRETWKCIGDLYFDRNHLKCLLPNLASRIEEDQCHDQEDGLYPVYRTNCRNYVRCKGGTTVDEKQCRANEMFSYNLQSCRISSEVSCVQSYCAQDNEGFFVQPGSKCQAYYLCRKGTRYDFLCPRGRTFDVSVKKCVEGGVCYEPICVGRTDGIYADTTHDCDRYFRCKGGELSEITGCPRSLKHNGFVCVPADKAKCENPKNTAVALYQRQDDECKTLQDGNHVIPGTDCRKIRSCLRGWTTNTFECPYNYRFNGNQCFYKDLVDCDNHCSGNPDGYYLDESKDCTEYYYCHNGRIKDRKKCRNGTINDEVCSGIPCGRRRTANLCDGLPDGYHPDYLHECRNYYYCHDHEMIVMNSCPEGMKWNGTACVDGYRCERPRPLPECRGAVTRLQQDFASNCSSYIYCKDGNGVVLKCPDGRLHDGVRCRDGNEYSCPNTVVDECYNQPEGYRQDGKSNCRSYFFCSKGSKITYVCAGDLVFNGSHCVSPDEYTCPYNTNDCDGMYNGYYPDETAGCRKYFYCLHEKRVTTLNCGGKKIFNGESCVLVPDSKEACSKAVGNPCHRRKDGKYMDKKSQCEKYIECKQQKMVDEVRCPRGSGFDGTRCSRHHSCPSKQPKTCDGTTVFITDYNSGCRNYYFCIGSLKMLATCPNGTIFNGKVCQDAMTYRCPVDGD